MKRGRTNHVIPKQPLRARESCDRPHQFKTNQSIRLSSPRVVNKRERERERETKTTNKRASPISWFETRQESRNGKEPKETPSRRRRKQRNLESSQTLKNAQNYLFPPYRHPPHPTPHNHHQHPLPPPLPPCAFPQL